MTTFDREVYLADLRAFRRILANHIDAIPADTWDARTGSRDRDWTLKQTLAHLVSIAILFNQATEAAARRQPLIAPGLEQREKLRAWNESQIATFAREPVEGLTAALFGAFDDTARVVEGLTAEQAQIYGDTPVYNRPARVMDFIDWQLSHAGVIHAAQIAYPTPAPPLWEHYGPELTHRQLERFIRHFSYVYWPEYGAGLDAAINFRVGGETGGDWHIVADADGGDFGGGAVDNARFEMQFADAATLFGLFTIHLTFPDALRSGALRVTGDFHDIMTVMKLYTPTPPKISL